MDEQAGPGVFFNNNNNSVLPGGAKAPQPGDGGGGGETARAQYSIPGILHFLQHEWARFEVERAQWEVERAELQAQIAFLQGERKGQENLKKDLVRRIKMLEYALKQERAKHHKLKYGTELNQGDMKPPSYDSDEGNENEALPEPPNSQLSWKQGRQLLRQYLQEVGYTDTILDVKSQRVKALLGLAGDSGERPGDKRAEPMVNGTELASLKDSTTTMIGKAEMSESVTVLEAFKFIEKAAAEFSDEDEDDDSEGQNKSIVDLSTVTEMSDDMDTDEVLKDFDFLANNEDMEGSPEAPSSGERADWEKDEQSPSSESWDVDEGLISKLKEQYKKERKGKKGVKSKWDRNLSLGCGLFAPPLYEWGPNRCKLQDMLANLRDAEDLSSIQPPVAPPVRPSLPRLNEPPLGRTDEVEALTFPPSSGKSFIMGTDEALESELGLGELAGLTVANEAENLSYDITNNKDALRKTWNPKFTLRNHFDSIRGLAFHPIEPVLITASEDHTLKMWNLQKTAPAKKCAALDVEPIYTFRAHRGPVLCVVMSSSGEQCFSGGLDATIQCWNTPSPNIDPYDSYEPSVLRGALSGHTDAVWGLVYSSAHHRLLSCSADGTVRLWSAADRTPAIAVFNENKGTDLLCSPMLHLFCQKYSKKFEILLQFKTAVFYLYFQHHYSSLQCHMIFRNHSNMMICKLIHSMVAHLDAVTSLAVDPNGLYLMSGSHDCSVRLWNMESKTCIQEFTAHRKKFDESINDVAFHPTKCYIGSAGADALAKVFV
uniref:Striatin, calmodulin binding protein n=1 Tax=Cyprinus carpio TaxID=7962 RepID=A0A8C2AF71_CYPCA